MEGAVDGDTRTELARVEEEATGVRNSGAVGRAGLASERTKERPADGHDCELVRFER